MHKRLAIAVLFLSLLVTGCSVTTKSITPEVPLSRQDGYEYRIGPEDILTISVWKNSDLSSTIVVRPDGKISLPLLNDVHVAGLTPTQLRDHLTERLQVYINDVELSVIVKEIHSLKISVLGQVANPARYGYKSRLTVLDAIAMAGGLTEFAARKRLVILRQNGRTLERIPFNFDQAASSNGALENFDVQPDDIVMVPRSSL